MKLISTIFILLFLACIGTSVASGRQDPPPTNPAPERSTCCKNDKDIPPEVATAIAVTIITTSTCAWKRFVLNNPCYTSAPRDTTAEDDWITPSNVRDTKQALQ